MALSRVNTLVALLAIAFSGKLGFMETVHAGIRLTKAGMSEKIAPSSQSAQTTLESNLQTKQTHPLTDSGVGTKGEMRQDSIATPQSARASPQGSQLDEARSTKARDRHSFGDESISHLLSVDKTPGLAADSRLFVVNPETGTIVAATGDGEMSRLSRTESVWATHRSTGMHLSAALFDTDRKQFVMFGATGQVTISNDDGLTWIDSATQLDDGVERAVVSPVGTMIASTTRGAIFRSSDHGVTWERILQTPNAERLVEICFITNRATGVALDNTGKMWKFSSSGDNWRVIPTNLPRGLGTLACGPDTAVVGGQAGSSFQTTWTTVEAKVGVKEDSRAIPGGDGRKRTYVGVVRSNERPGALEMDPITGALAFSQDDGEHWNEVESKQVVTKVIFDSRRQHYLAVGAGKYSWSDGINLRDWATEEAPGNENFIDVVAYGRGDRDLAAVSQNGALFDSKDGGRTWALVLGAVPKAFHLVGLVDGVLAFGEETYQGMETQEAIPRVVSISVASSSNKEMSVDIVLDDPQNLCASHCIEVAGWSASDYAHRFNLLPRSIPSNRISARSPSTYRVTFDPTSELSAAPNTDVHLFVTLNGEGFKVRYPDISDGYILSFTVDRTLFFATLPVFVLVALTFFLFAFFPASIVKASGSLEQFSNFFPSEKLQSLIRAFANLFVFPIVLTSSRVLNAWSREQAAMFAQRCGSIGLGGPVAYFPLEVGLVDGQGKKHPFVLEKKTIGKIIKTDDPSLLICGMGGTGKSSLAFEIARLTSTIGVSGRLFLPLWISNNLSLPTGIQEQVRQIAGDENLPPKFIKALQKQKYLIVFVDGLSEFGGDTKLAWQEYASKGYLTVVTSRKSDVISSNIRIETRYLDSRQATDFLGATVALLETNGADPFHLRAKIFESFGTLVRRNAPISALLIRLFVENFLATESDGTTARGAKDLPQVYFDYLRNMFERAKDVNCNLRVEEMFRICKSLAVLELDSDFLPKLAKLDDALLRITSVLGDPTSRSQALDHFLVLEKSGVIRTQERFGNVTWRFEFDPVAEYVAATWFAERGQREVEKVRQTIDGLLVQPSGFIDALNVVLATRSP